jgi:subtilase family serine protease
MASSHAVVCFQTRGTDLYRQMKSAKRQAPLCSIPYLLLRNVRGRYLSYLSVAMLAFTCTAYAQEKTAAITSPAVYSQKSTINTFTNAGVESYVARRYARNDLGLESGERLLHQMKLVLKPTAETDAALKRFLEDQRDSKSPNFHKWLTPDQFAERFGAPASSIDKATEWLRANGMSEIEVSRGHRFITFAGPVANVSAGFKTTIHAYNVDSTLHFANAAEPSIPAEISDAVYGVVGLNDFNPKPQAVIAKPQFWFANAGYNFMGSDDFATMYDIHTLYSQGINGSGVTIAVIGSALIDLSDYQSFRSYFGLPTNDYQVIAVPNLQSGLSPITSQSGLEATQDLQMVTAIARNSTILYIQGTSDDAGVQYVIDNQLAQIISASYGGCETAISTYHIYEQQMAQQANAEGITWVAATGDFGPANCDFPPETAATQGFALLLPSSVPEVTAVGGTEIIYTDASGSPYWSTTNNANGGNILSYVPETVWNDTENGQPINGPFSAGGGGMSAYFPKPGFQAGLGGSGVVNRMVPDVSLNASNADVPNIIYYNGSMTGAGGTSASAPLFAGMLGLIENYLMAHGSISTPGLGNVNPSLYNINQNVPSAFHDITTGDNDVNCVIGTPDCTTGRMGYPATVGYDMATGLGSVDLYVLASNWANYQAASSTTALSVNTTSQTAVQNVTFTTKTTAASGNPQNGVITLTYDNPTNQLYRGTGNGMPGPFPATGTADSAGSATITTSLLPAGVNTITADFGGSASVNSSVSNAVTVTVTAFPTTITVVPSATTAPVGSTVNLTVTVVGPTGQSPILSSTLPGNTGRVYLFPASGSEYSDALLPMSGMLTIQTPTLLAGANTFIVSFSGTAYAAGVSTTVFTITGGTSTPTVTVTPALSSITTLQPLSVTVVVSGTPTPTGTVTLSNGSYNSGAITLSGGSATINIIAGALAVGTDTLTASYAPDSNSSPIYNSATGVASITVNPIAPTITFSVPNHTYGDAPFTVSATSNSTGAITYSLFSGPAIVSNSSVTLNGAGTVVLLATQAASGSYGAGTQTASFTVGKATPTVSVTPSASSITTVQSLSVTVAVSGNSTGTVTLTSSSYNSGAIALSGGSATIVIPAGALAVGSNTLTASYSGDSNYSANTGSASVTASLAAPTITFTVANHTYGDAPFTVSASSNSSGAIVYSVSSGPATITGSTVTLTGAGTVALLATQAAAGSYDAGTQPASFTVGKATPTVLVTPAASSITTAQSLSVTVAVSGNPTDTVILSSGSYNSVAIALNGGSATIVIPSGALAVGSDTLTASYSGDTNYNANTGSATVVVSLPPVPGLTISGTAVTLLPGAATGNASTITVTPTGGFTGAVTLTATITSSPSGAQDLPGLSFGATSPVTITGASAGTATLTITTTAASTGRLKDSAQGEVRWYAAGAALACLLLSGLSLRRHRAWGWLAMIVLAIIFTGGLTACGGGSTSKVSNPGTTAGAYTITVTGTSGALTAQSTINLTVQ